MDKYCKHFLMDTEEAKIYSKDVVKYFAPDEKLEAKEIGDGNINYVFKIWNPETGKSLIIKQADTLLRSSGRPLDVGRILRTFKIKKNVEVTDNGKIII